MQTVQITALSSPWLYAGSEVPPWYPENSSSDLLQYWYDLIDPAIANPEVLSYRPILQWSGSYHPTAGLISNPAPVPDVPGNLRPYQPGRCYLGDGAAYVKSGLVLYDVVETGFTVLFTATSEVTTRDFLTVGTSATVSSLCVFVRHSSSGVQLYVHDGYSGITPITVGQEYTYALTYDGNVNTGTAKLYIDGELKLTHTGGVSIDRPNCDLFMFTGFDGKLEGTIRDVRVLDSVITDEEIQQYTAGTLQTDHTDTIGLYKYDESTGDTVYDSSGNGNHGTILNNYPGFHAQQDKYSFQNEVGYTLGTGSNGAAAGVYIPRNESSTHEDVLGNPLQYYGRAQGYGVLKNLPCLIGDGSAQIILPAGTVVSNGGTADLTGLSGTVTIPDGETVWNIVMSGGEEYPCSERGGLTLHDISGNGNDIQLANYNILDIWGTQDEYAYNQQNGFNRRLEWYTGANGLRLSLPTSGDLPVGVGSKSYEFWCYIPYTVNSERVIEKSSNPTNFVITIVGTSGLCNCYVGNGQIAAYGSVSCHNKITHVVIRYNLLTGNGDVWVDGVLDRARTFTPGEFSSPDLAYIASTTNGTLGLKGSIWGIRMYDGWISDADIVDRYNKIEISTPVLADWPLNDINPPALNRARDFVSSGPDVLSGPQLDIVGKSFWFDGWQTSTTDGIIFQHGTNFKLEVLTGNLIWTVNSIAVTAAGGSHFQVYYDNSEIGIVIDGGTPVTSAVTPIGTLDGNLVVGDAARNGTIEYLYYGEGVQSLDLYNDGYGTHFLELTDSSSITSAWMGNESSDQMTDWKGANHLQVTSGDPQSTSGFRETRVKDISGNGYTGILSGSYNWLDQPVAADPEVPAGVDFLPALNDQIDWQDYLNTNANFPWAVRDNKVNWPVSYIYGDTTGGRHIATTDQFARLSYDQGIDRFLNYREALTGDDLTNAQEYTK